MPRFIQMTAVAFYDVLGCGLAFGIVALALNFMALALRDLALLTSLVYNGISPKTFVPAISTVPDQEIGVYTSSSDWSKALTASTVSLAVVDHARPWLQCHWRHGTQQWLKWGGQGGSGPLLRFQPPPCSSMSPLIESIKCYFVPKYTPN